MLRSLFASASSLRSHQDMLDVTGNNLANINTTGFKGQRIRFGTQFAEIIRSATPPGAPVGGTNPSQIGHGVRSIAVDSDFNQGTLEPTGNPLDMAIEGRGFFVLTDQNGNQLYTRAGAFSADSSEHLVESSSGLFVKRRLGGIGEQDINGDGASDFQPPGDVRINLRQFVDPKQTENVSFVGNLDPDANPAVAAKLTGNLQLTTNGANNDPATLTTPLNNLNQTISGYNADDQIHITGTTITGKSVNAIFSAVGGGVDTVANLLDVINQAFSSGSPNGATAALVDGVITLTADRPGPGPLALNLSSGETVGPPLPPNTGETDFGNFPTTTPGTAGDTTSTAIEVFDAQGNAHTLNLVFEKAGDNEWDLTARIDSADIPSTMLDNRVRRVSFDENGRFQGVATAEGPRDVDTQNQLATTLPLTSTDPLAALPVTSTMAAVVAGAPTLLNELDGITPFAGALPDDEIEVIIERANPNPPFETVTSRFQFSAVTGAPVGAANTVDDLLTFLNDPQVLDSGNATNPEAATATLVNGNIVIMADRPGQTEMGIVSLRLESPRFDFDDFTVTTAGQSGDSDITFEFDPIAGFGTRQSVALDFSAMTQSGGPFSASAASQDGFPKGDLVSVSVESNGALAGIFSNGTTHQIAQLEIATFPNRTGLFRVGANAFREDTNSGAVVLGQAGANGVGIVQGEVLEVSNVDVTIEFTRLITAQRGFQAAARSFTTADQVLQEAVNLKQ